METAHWSSTCDFRPLKFCYPGAAEIYKLLRVPIKKPMHCLTTQLISNLTEKNKTHSCFSYFFFTLKKKVSPTTTAADNFPICAHLPTPHTPSRPQVQNWEQKCSFPHGGHALTTKPQALSQLSPSRATGTYSSDSAVRHRSCSELC